MQKLMPRPLGLLTILGAFMFVTACDDTDSPSTPEQVPDAIDVATLAVTFDEPGQSQEIYAVVLDQLGGTIVAAPISWTSADETVATVSEDGLIEATGYGETVVTASHEDVSADIDVVVVEQMPEQVAIDPLEHTFTAVDEVMAFTATVYDSEGTEMPEVEVLWETSDENVVVIDPDGEAVAVGEGEATLTATAGDAYATADVTVETEG